MANQPANGHATAIPLKRFFERVAGYDALDAGRALAGRQAERARYTTNLVVGDVDLLDHGGQSNWEGEQLFGGELFLLYRAKNKIVGRSCYFTGGSARGGTDMDLSHRRAAPIHAKPALPAGQISNGAKSRFFNHPLHFHWLPKNSSPCPNDNS